VNQRFWLLAGVIGAGVSASAARADWLNFRGPNHDGISPETGLKTAWSGPIPLVWERQVGSGFSSFAAVGDRIYTCGTQDANQTALCLDANSGQVIWQTVIEKEYHDSSGGDGPRATPTVDGDRVFVLGAHGTLLCLDAASGTQVWRHTFSHAPQWGYSGSVLIEGDLAVSSGGGSDGALVAFNKKTGEVVWRQGEDRAGYATPYPFDFAGTRYILGFNGDTAEIVEARDGRQVWRTEWKTDWDVNAASPIVQNDHLLLTSGYSTGAGLFKLRRDGDRLAADEIWRSKALLNKFQSCILHEGNLYASDQKALKCVDFLTGESRWEIRRVQNGTLVLADGHLFLLTEDGQLQIAKADPTAFEPLTTAEILAGRCWTVPVLHRGRLYARNLERVVCFDLR